MKVTIISIVCLMQLALAEPPVGDGYAARSSHDDHQHASGHQRSLSQEYGPPTEFGSARNAPSDGYEYNSPNARNALNTRGRSQFAPAKVRVSFNQNFGRAASRSSAQDHASPDARSLSQEYNVPQARNGISQEYGAPSSRSSSPSQEYGAPSVSSARTLSTEYGVPNARSSPSDEYGVPAVGRSNQNHQSPASRSLSQEYGVPSISSARTFSTDNSGSNARSSPSEEYGAPAVARSNQNHQSPASNFRSAQPSISRDHSTPAVRSQFQTDSSAHGYSAPSARSNDIAESYDAPKPFAKASGSSDRSFSSSTYDASSRSLSYSYGTPSVRNSNSINDETVSQNYDAHSNSNGVPSTRGVSQEYGVPSSRSNQMTDAVTSSFASARSAPSSTYLPASRSAAPSEQYGVPEQRDTSSQGYDDVRARALEELQNQEPASYDFGYQIEDQESGSDFGHTEIREENRAQGSYFVVRPDGSKQTVDYEADERGFKPRISVEPAAGGYDDNAQDITGRAAEGPY